MSGHKSAIITISQEEYRRLYEAERKLYYEQLSQTRSELENEIENQVLDLSDHLEDRQSQFIELIQNLDEDIREIEQQSSKHLLENQIENLYAFVHNQNERIDSEREDFAQREQRLLEKLSEAENESKQKFSLLFQEIMEQRDTAQNIQGLAQGYLDASNQLYLLIQNSYPEHIFSSDTFRSFADYIRLIESNIYNHADQAAISLGQTTYLGLSAFKKSCDNRYITWQIQKNKVEEEIKILLNEFQRNQEIQPVDKSGNEIGARINTNYWTQGLFNDLHQKVLQMRTYFEEKKDAISKQELKSIYLEFIEPVQDLQIQCMMDARINALNAQIRYEIANSVLVALVEQGFKPVSGDYENGDFFSSYQASAVNSSGNQVNIVVDPGTPNMMEITLHVVSVNPKATTLSELRSRANEIRKSLFAQGLEVGDFVEEPSSADRTVTQNKPRRSSLPKNNQ